MVGYIHVVVHVYSSKCSRSDFEYSLVGGIIDNDSFLTMNICYWLCYLQTDVLKATLATDAVIGATVRVVIRKTWRSIFLSNESFYITQMTMWTTWKTIWHNFCYIISINIQLTSYNLCNRGLSIHLGVDMFYFIMWWEKLMAIVEFGRMYL